jgi:methionyl-tRNA formyltransferase
MKRKLRIVFMGTPAFAVESLRKLTEHHYDIAAVVTVPDKPSGRGQKVHESAVKQFATEKGLKILQPVKLKDENFLNELRSLKANLFIVVAFRMLPEVVWTMPELGTFNLHASLLPQYRGAAPINWSIIHGDHKTGVTTFFLKHEIDTGDLIFQEEIDIEHNDTAGTLHDKLMTTGAVLVLKTVKTIEKGDVQAIPQKHIGDLKHAPKIFKEDCLLDFTQTAESVRNKIRGLSPYPGAYTYLDGKVLKIFAAQVLEQNAQLPAGTFHSDGKSYIHIACSDCMLSLLDIQLEGKKRLQTEEFLRGYRWIAS